jgi:HAMP domain-containing protein
VTISLKVKAKLVAVLVPPLAAMGVLATIGVTDRRSEVEQASGMADATRSVFVAADLTAALAQEQAATAALAARSSDADIEAVAAARRQTDAALAAARSDGRWAELAATSSSSSTIDETDRALRSIGSVRQQADRGTESARQALQSIAQIVELANRSTALLAEEGVSVSDDVTGAVLAQLAALHMSLGDQLSTVTLAAAGPVEPMEQTTLVTAQLLEITERSALQVLATPVTRLAFRQLGSSPAARDLQDAGEEVVGESGRPTFDQVAGAVPVLAEHRAALTDVAADSMRRIDGRIDAAQSEEASFTLLIGVVSALALLAAFIVARSITVPLRRLVDAAHDVADHQLPAMVSALRSPTARLEAPVETLSDLDRGDEIGELARAFSQVQRTAVSVASEQAVLLRKGISDLFVNLARRNQSLLDRQIGHLDRLEASETDPDTLADLFQLDHLATRMRRNAESLLILAGVDSTRRWSHAVSIDEVIQGAIGEVDDYARIRLGATVPLRVHGPAVNDLSHLVAEFLDNATQFSPPDQVVTVNARIAAHGLEIEVRDRGIGMSAEAIDAANTVLIDPPITGLELSRSLGFIVVGRLAHRHAIRCRLVSGRDGVTAIIEVPAALLEGHHADRDAPVLDAASTDAVALPAPVLSTGTVAPVTEQPFDDRIGATPDHQSTGRFSFAGPTTHHATGQIPMAPRVDVPSISESESSTPPVIDHSTPLAVPPTTPSSSPSRPDDVPAAVWARFQERPAPAWNQFLARTDHTGELSITPSQSVGRLSDALAGSRMDDAALAAEAAALVDDRPPPASWPVVAPSPAPTLAAVPPQPDSAEPPTFTAAGLPRRRPGAVVAPLPSPVFVGSDTATTPRTPDEVRALLSSYRSGLTRGRSVTESSDLPHPSVTATGVVE